jgi:hypothetical protein
MGIINTLYGHFDSIQQIDILGWPRVISCGGHDKTCRLFKIFEDSHLVFNSHFDSTSVDTISMINEEHFVTGTANGYSCNSSESSFKRFIFLFAGVYLFGQLLGKNQHAQYNWHMASQIMVSLDGSVLWHRTHIQILVFTAVVYFRHYIEFRCF